MQAFTYGRYLQIGRKEIVRETKNRRLEKKGAEGLCWKVKRVRDGR